MGVLLGARGRHLALLVLTTPAFALLGCPQVLEDDFSRRDVAETQTAGSGGTKVDLVASSTNTTLPNESSSGGVPDTGASSTGGSGGGMGNGGSGAANGQPDASVDASEDDAGDSDAGDSDAGDNDAGDLDAGADPDAEVSDAGCSAENEVCNGLDDDCDDEVDEGNVCPALCSGFSIGGTGYVFCGTALSAADAADQCARFQMGLVSIESKSENNSLVELVAPLHDELAEPNGEQPAFWTSGTDSESEGDWRWGSGGDAFWQGSGSGQPVDGAYSNWGAGRPNEANSAGEDCNLVYVSDGEDGYRGEWNDIDCSKAFSFVCEP